VKGVKLFEESGFQPVVAVSPAASHPMWCFTLEGDRLLPISREGLHMRSQDLPLVYVVNGAFYLTTPSDLRGNHSFYAENMIPLIMNSEMESLDIDTEFDWQVAQTFLG
jgi:CMP-N-acetylneuraminic acid synthetase